MERTCSQCGKSFAHASSLSRHKKVCGSDTPRLPCPHCATTFGRASDLRRHVQHSCKGKKRPAEEVLPETPPEKYRLVDYDSSEEEMSQQEVSRKAPAQAWRTTAELSSDTESEEDFTAAQQEESEDEESWHTADESWDSEEQTDYINEEEPVQRLPHVDALMIEEEGEETVPEASAQSEVLSLDTLKKALPWDQYQGISEEQFSAARQQMGGNPLFEFDFLPVSDQQWLRRVQKTVYHTRLRQRRAPEDTDDMGVAIVKALEESTRQQLERIGARDED